MYQAAFSLNKLRRAIRTQGRTLEIIKPTCNKFKEPNGEAEVFEVKGIFRESVAGFGYIGRVVSEAATTRQKPYTLVLCLWEDVSGVNPDCTAKFQGKSYKICGVKNFAEANLVADMSLEEVLDDGQRTEI